MQVINVRNVSEALPVGVEFLRVYGAKRESRNGPVLVAPCPVTTVYERPWERVLLYGERDANPFFHVFEAAWMLAGRDDVKSVAKYVSRMKTYSDDGKTLHGAYGARWRNWFPNEFGDGNPIDQLAWAVRRLRANPDDRRVVIQMWDAGTDIATADTNGKDVPCNTQMYVWIDVEGRLSLTITCRSNDMVWGAYGANAVHFSFVQQFLAEAIGVPMGKLYQISNNYHGYLNTLEPLFGMQLDQPYASSEWTSAAENQFRLCDAGEDGVRIFTEDLALFLDEKVTLGIRSPWIRKVLQPIVMAHRAYKERDDNERFEKAHEIVKQMQRHSPDWYAACVTWLARREEQARRAKDDGVSHA